MTAHKNPLRNWTCPLHRAMQIEIGRQMRSDYELPRELPRELATSLNKLLALPSAEAEEAEPRYRARKLLQRAMACENAAGRAANEGIKEIYLDLAGQYRNLARQHELVFATK